MAIDIENTDALRSYSDLKRLVEAVHNAGAADEHHAVEWKSSLDLSKAAGAYAVSRTILGLSNRAVHSARRHFEGLAYLLVGVEPGTVHGMPQWDGEKLGPAIEKYLGVDGPIWQHANVTFREANVLVFTIEAPKAGDPIRTLRRAYQPDVPNSNEKGAREGEIFVRRGARTERANTAEIRELETRLIAGNGPAAVNVELTADGPEPTFVLSVRDATSEVREWVDGAVDKIRQSLVRSRSYFSGMSFGGLEDRSEEEFQAELEEYDSAMERFAADMLRQTVVTAAFERPLRFRVVNPDDIALEDVLVKVSTPRWLEQHFSVPEANRPTRPHDWGTVHSFSPAFLRPMPHVAPAPAMALPLAQLHKDLWISSQRIDVLHGDTAQWLEEMVFLAVNPPEEPDGEVTIEVTARNRRGTQKFRRRFTLSETMTWARLTVGNDAADSEEFADI